MYMIFSTNRFAQLRSMAFTAVVYTASAWMLIIRLPHTSMYCVQTCVPAWSQISNQSVKILCNVNDCCPQVSRVEVGAVECICEASLFSPSYTN